MSIQIANTSVGDLAMETLIMMHMLPDEKHLEINRTSHEPIIELMKATKSVVMSLTGRGMKS